MNRDLFFSFFFCSAYRWASLRGELRPNGAWWQCSDPRAKRIRQPYAKQRHFQQSMAINRKKGIEYAWSLNLEWFWEFFEFLNETYQQTQQFCFLKSVESILFDCLVDHLTTKFWSHQLQFFGFRLDFLQEIFVNVSGQFVPVFIRNIIIRNASMFDYY